MKYFPTAFWFAAAALAGWSLAQSAAPPGAPPGAPPVDPPASSLFVAGGEANVPASQPGQGGPAAGANLSPAVRQAPLSEAQRGQVLDFLKAEEPELFQSLQGVKDQDRQRYSAMLEQAGHRTLYLIELKQGDPELYGLYREEMKFSREISRLGGEVRQAGDPANRSELVGKLRGELKGRFEVTQDRQRLLFARFSTNLKRLDDMIRMREANKEKIIEQQLNAIVAERTPASRPE